VIFLVSSALSLKIAHKVHSGQDDLTRLATLESRVAALMNQWINNNVVNSTYGRYNPDGVNIFNYMYKDAIVYPDIFNALESNIIQKSGAPVGWDQTSNAQTVWNLKRILRIGNTLQSNANGLQVNIPAGYDVLWIRVLGDRWETFRVSPSSPTASANFTDWTEYYAAGYRNLNGISPDGSAPDSQWNIHQWIPIPIRQQGSMWVYSDRNSDCWISGIAFGKNLWNHAMNPAVAYLWKLNPQYGEITWVSENWNNDQVGKFEQNSNTEVSVPVVFSGKDKIIYLVEHNNNWLGSQHGRVFVNGQEVERFRTSYDNPFSTHHNSKIYNRYMATRIPKSLIKQGDRFVRLRIDMIPCNNHLHFREIGTHDYI